MKKTIIISIFLFGLLLLVTNFIQMGTKNKSSQLPALAYNNAANEQQKTLPLNRFQSNIDFNYQDDIIKLSNNYINEAHLYLNHFVLEAEKFRNKAEAINNDYRRSLMSQKIKTMEDKIAEIQSLMNSSNHTKVQITNLILELQTDSYNINLSI